MLSRGFRPGQPHGRALETVIYLQVCGRPTVPRGPSEVCGLSTWALREGPSLPLELQPDAARASAAHSA